MSLDVRGGGGGGDNIRVLCRFRPVNSVERSAGSDGSKVVVSVHENCKGVTIGGGRGKQKTFYFDYVFPPTSNQDTVFKYGALPLVDNVFQGYNCTLFAYGQTGSGKTFTMEGEIGDDVLEGLIPRMVRALFDQIASDDGDGHEFSIKVSYVEIYNEQVNDLLDPRKRNLTIQSDSTDGFGVCIRNVTEAYVSEPRDVFAQLHNGYVNRSVASTSMNEDSSRSHAVFTLKLEMKKPDGSLRKSKLMMVDLAGSEKVRKTNATGQTLKEAKNINKSLSHLGLVINSLVEGKHASFRTSKLTRLLSDALGGNSKTSLIVTASPAKYNADETVSTLRFGYRAKAIKNKAVVNEELSIAEYKKLLQRAQEKNSVLKKQISDLQNELSILSKAAKKKGIDVDSLLANSRRANNVSMTTASLMMPTKDNSANKKQIEILQSQVEKTNSLMMEMQEKLEKSKEELEDKIQDEMLLRQNIAELEMQVQESRKLRNAHAQLKVAQAALEGLQTQKQGWEQWKQETKLQYEGEIEALRIDLTQYKKMAIDYKATSEAYEQELEKALENPAHLRKAGHELMRIKSSRDPNAFDASMMDDLDDEILLQNDSNNAGGIETDEKLNNSHSSSNSASNNNGSNGKPRQSNKNSNSYNDEGDTQQNGSAADIEEGSKGKHGQSQSQGANHKNGKTPKDSSSSSSTSKNLTEQQLKEMKVLFNFSRKLQERCKKYESEQKKLKAKLKVYKKRDDVNKQLRENWNKQLEQMEAAVLLANEIYHRERLAHESQIAEKNVEIVKLRKFLISLTNGRMNGMGGNGGNGNGKGGNGSVNNKTSVRQSRIKVPIKKPIRKAMNPNQMLRTNKLKADDAKVDS